MASASLPQGSTSRRLALYGFVGPASGSLASANSLIVDELLARGHSIDFYAIDQFIRREALPEHPRLNYIPIAHRGAQRVWQWFDRRGGLIKRFGYSTFGPISNELHYRLLGKAIRQQHREAPYDALLSLGLLSPWRLPGAPTVSWTQGTPNGEAFWFARHAGDMIRYGAGHLLVPIAAIYAFKFLEAAFLHPRSDHVVCGSQWAVGSWQQFGVRRNKLSALPYVVDLAKFSAAASPSDKPAEEVLFLHLGRIVPRKRFDLLLRGFALARQREPTAKLLVVGGFSIAPGYQRLLDNPALNEGVEYRPVVPRSEVPGLLARADVIVQPSECENFGSAIMEGLASGRPVLAGPTNGTTDYISAGSLVFKDYTPQALADGICEMIRRVRADRPGLAVDARATAERNFDVRVVTEQLLAIVDATRMKFK